MKIFPKHSYGTPILKTISEWLCLLFMLLPIGYMISMWGTIPAEIPTHYGASGVADAYGSKSTLIFMGFMMIFMYFTLKFAMSFPQSWNISGVTSTRRQPKSMTNGKKFREYTDEEIENAYNMMSDMLSWVNMITMGMFFYMTFCMMFAKPLGVLFMLVFVGGLFVVMGYYMFKIYKRQPDTGFES